MVVLSSADRLCSSIISAVVALTISSVLPCRRMGAMVLRFGATDRTHLPIFKSEQNAASTMASGDHGRLRNAARASRPCQNVSISALRSCAAHARGGNVGGGWSDPVIALRCFLNLKCLGELFIDG